MVKNCIYAFIVIFGYSVSAHAEPNCSGAYDGTDFYDFKIACFKHDVCYSEGKLLGLTKEQCDNRFYNHMKISCIGRSFICDIFANSYYSAVKNMSNKVFEDASQKTYKTFEFINRYRGTEDVRNLLAIIDARKRGQVAWTQKYRECRLLPEESPARNRCAEEKGQIKVPDMPSEFHLGDCNVLGIKWKNGHRTANTIEMAKATGVPRSVIESNVPGDPCEGKYPYEYSFDGIAEDL